MMMTRLTEAEEGMMELIWDHENLTSRELVELCRKQFEWKKSTTYTILSRLIKKGMAQNENAKVSGLMTREEYRYLQGKNVIREYFHDSLPSFITAFAKEEKLSRKDIEQLEKIIEEYK